MDLIPYLLEGRRNFGQGGLVRPGNQLPIDPIATGEALGNIAKNTYDYFNEQGDFARPAKWADKRKIEQVDEYNETEYKDMELDYNQQGALEGMDTNQMKAAGGGSAAPGPKGSLVGKTQTKKGYERYFHERVWAHSKKIRIMTLLWGFSTFDQPSYNDEKLKLYKWGGQGLTYIKEEEYIDSGINCNIWKPHYSAANTHNKNFSDLVLACALNLYVDDFFDKKLYDNVKKTGVFVNYHKLRLKSITVTITPKTYWGGVKHQAHWLLARTERFNTTGGGDKKYYPAYYEEDDMHELDMDYYVYRDLYGAYGAEIPDIPPEAFNASVTLSRTCRTIRAHDNNLEIMSNKKPFSFTREVSSTGNYFISPDTLSAQRKKPIHDIINELEGQIGTSTYINKFPEYLGLLIVPTHMPVVFNGQIQVADGKKGYLLDSSFHTILQVKYNATWECFDYKHSDYTTANPPNPTIYNFETESIIDPLIYAERDFMAQKELENMQRNTN